MKLAVDTLDTTKKVTCFFEDSKTLVGCRIHLIKIGTLTDGDLILTVKVNGNQIYQKSIGYETLNTLGNFWHGFKEFQFDKVQSVKKVSTQEKNIVVFEFSTTCTMTDTVYLGLVKETLPTTPIEYTVQPIGSPEHDIWINPFGFELYTYK